jgi:2-C-methyl-D-erythritol 2,4-cyclodiphosphate synthase
LVRVGFGTDSHPFDPGTHKPLVLAGIRITNFGGLKANSDGDVILHALFNALSQACGGQSIGHYADPLLEQGIRDSREYLEIPLDMVSGMGYRIQNIGIMVEAARPRIPPQTIKRMRNSIAHLTGIGESDVGLTFTSGEGLTAFGRGEGILAQAIVSLTKE